MSASDIYLPPYRVKVIYNSFLLGLEKFGYFFICNLGPTRYNLTSVSLGLLPTTLRSWGLLSITLCQFSRLYCLHLGGLSPPFTPGVPLCTPASHLHAVSSRFQLEAETSHREAHPFFLKATALGSKA